MSDTYNLAGKKLIVDSIEETGRSVASLQSIRGAYDVAKAKLIRNELVETIDDVHDGLVETIEEVSGALGDLTEEVTEKLDDVTGTVTTSLNTLVDQVAGTESSGLKTLIGDTKTDLEGTIGQTKTDLEGTISTTETTLRTYADTKKTEAIASANGYAETKKTEAISSANGYTDQEVGTAITTANGYTDQEVGAAITSANGYTDTSVGNLNTSVTSVLRRVGARKVTRSSALQIDVYCYNPRKEYHYFDDSDPDPTQYQDDYYASAGFVRCDGMNLPVYIAGNYSTFTPANHGGIWVIGIYKANAQDDAYTPLILHPFANGQVMEWRLPDDTAISSALLLNTWIIGSFRVTLSGGSVSDISELFVSQEGVTPSSFLKKSFMQMMNDADSTTDFNDWSIAMGCDQVFTRIAVLEAFIDKLNANDALFKNITVSGLSNFLGQIHNDAIDTFSASSPNSYTGSFNGEAKKKDGSSYYYCYVSEANMISVLGSSALSFKATGTITLSNNTTFTGTEANPFFLDYVPRTSIRIAGGNIGYYGSDLNWYQNISMAYESNPYITDGFYGVDKGLVQASIIMLDSISLTVITSLGGFYSHDILPRNTNVDKIGTSQLPFSEIWIGSSVIARDEGESVLPNGLKIKWGRKQLPTSAGSGNGTVYYNTAFDSWEIPFAVYANYGGDSGSVFAASNSKTYFSYIYSVPSSSYNWLHWFAIGV